MLRKIEVLTAIGTLCCAMGIGFVMQSSDSAEQRYGPKLAAVQPQIEVEAQVTMASATFGTMTPFDNSLLDVQDITLTSAAFDPKVDVTFDLDTAEISDLTISKLPEPDLIGSLALAGCEVTATAEPIAAAMVDLKLFAPCLPNERVTVHHSGLIFSEVTSDTGALFIEVPALTEDAVFVMAFSSGEGAIASTKVEELADFDRSVLEWKGNAGFEIHAREFGAAYGDAGHRWAGSPGDLASAVAGKSGVLTRHGNTSAMDPLLAEVYTFPRSSDGQSGDVVLTVEAEVTPENCGLEVEAQSLEMQPNGEVLTRNLILPVPACDSIGSFLVLNNLLQNLKVAAK